jgi:hypothetical protein
VNKPVAKLEPEAEVITDPLALLRKPFAPHHISKLPKPTKAQTDAVKNDFKKGIRCAECGSWHHPDVVHLDYVGHAALTDRLLDADPMWSWEPVAFNDAGLPAFDNTGGLWIKLTVAGVTRLGYGHAAPKPNADPGAREKEVIGDALRNAAMRFGAALDLWHKGDLHPDEPEPAPPTAKGSGEIVTGRELLDRQRKTSAQAKRDGDHDKYTRDIASLDEAGIADWTMHFDEYTADAPLSWLDPLRDKLELRREELAGQRNVGDEAEAMDAAFRASVGPASVGGVAGNGIGRAVQ